MKAYAVPTGNPPADVARLRQLIGDTRGRFFRVVFLSRRKNEARDMRARLKRTGSERVDSDRWNSQVTVFDVEKKDYRTLPLERVVYLRCGEIEWVTEVRS